MRRENKRFKSLRVGLFFNSSKLAFIGLLQQMYVVSKWVDFFIECLHLKKYLLGHLMLALNAHVLHVEKPPSLVFWKHTPTENHVLLVRPGLSQ